MSGRGHAFRINSIIGKPVLSLATGNKLGTVRGAIIDPANGVLIGLALNTGGLACDEVYSFGRDAIMTESELAVVPVESSPLADGRDVKGIIGARIVTAAGEVLGRISSVLITVKTPPVVIYGLRRSLMDWLLGRELYLPASATHALSDDAGRLVVPQDTAGLLSADPKQAAAATISVRTFDPAAPARVDRVDDDETIVRTSEREDETVVRLRDDDETVVRRTRVP